ncbi:MAG: matrixin family metalloprotease [Candidatus Aquicultor sp.]
MTRTSRVFVIALTVALVMSLGAQTAFAGTLDLLGVGWTKSPVNVQITAKGNVSDAAIADVEQAISDWNGAMSRVNQAPALQVVNGLKAADINIQLKGGSGVVLGMTSFKTERASCALKSVSIQLSSKIFGQNFSNVGTQNVARHEVGHALGLGHCNDGPNDLMYPTLESSGITGNTVMPISALDIMGIDAIYPFDGTCGTIPSSVSNLVGAAHQFNPRY